jgi:S-adenosylmethionine synthetase
VLHYNLDKGLLAAGSVEHRFGGGRMVEPTRLIVGDGLLSRSTESACRMRKS